MFGLAVGVLTMGASMSFTVTSNEQESLDPSKRCPVIVTVVVPTGKNVPESLLAETVPQFPVYVGAG